MDSQALVVIALTGVAAITDAQSGRIPNWLTLPAIVGAPVAHGLVLGPTAVVWSLLGIFVCGLAPLLLFTCGAMGGGDVKLFAALGAVLGSRGGLELQVVALGVTTVLALFVLVWRGRLLATLAGAFWLAAGVVSSTARARRRPPELMETMRMGPAICVSSLLLCVGESWPL